MESLANVQSRWQALNLSIDSEKIDDEDKKILQEAKAYERNMGILQKGAIYAVCILGVLRFQRSNIAMLGLISTAAIGTLASDIYLSNKTWKKSS